MNQSSSLIYKCPFKGAEPDKNLRKQQEQCLWKGLGVIDNNASKKNSVDSYHLQHILFSSLSVNAFKSVHFVGVWLARLSVVHRSLTSRLLLVSHLQR